ncbi:MAG: dihydrodipicolinate synthase family protein [Pseudomonadota bacterium]
MLPKGIIPSLNTPFTADDRVDQASLIRLVEDCVDAGCAGLLALAVAGETASLEVLERDRVLAAVMEGNRGRLPVIVGVSAPDLATSIARARRAVAAGSSAILWQPPGPMEEDRLQAALSELGDQGTGTVVLQDLDWQGEGLPIRSITRLFERVEAFRAIKIETVRAGPKYTEVLAATGGALHVSGGWAVTQMIEALERGVHAFMPTGMERVYVEIHRCFAAGRADEARALFEAALPALAFANQHIDVSIRFFKRLRAATGIFTTDRCRPPVPPLDPFQDSTAERLIRSAQALDARLG